MSNFHVSNQILDVKQRSGRYGVSIYDVIHQLNKLKMIVADADAREDILGDFIPIRITTCIEVIVRNLIREIIEYGSPYSERAEKYAKAIKFDFLLSSAIQGQKITLGDIIAHSVSTNSLSQIIGLFEVLIEEKFRDRLAKIYNRSAFVLDGNDSPIILEPEIVFRAVDQLLRIRHIVVHEMPEARPYNTSDLQNFIECSEQFLAALDELVTQELKGDYPVTQADMTKAAYDAYAEARKELARKILRIRKSDDLNRSRFYKAHLACK
jgi:hypothetical protein